MKFINKLQISQSSLLINNIYDIPLYYKARASYQPLQLLLFDIISNQVAKTLFRHVIFILLPRDCSHLLRSERLYISLERT